MKRNGGFVGLAWGFVRPVGRGGRPTIGVRHSSIADPQLGATPRVGRGSHDLDTPRPGGGDPAETNLAPHLDIQGLVGGGGGSSRRVEVPLFRWQALGSVALAQATALGLAPLPTPAASPCPLVYLQWLRRRRLPYPASLALRVGPLTRPTRAPELPSLSAADKSSSRNEHDAATCWRPTMALQIERGAKSKLGHLYDMEALSLSSGLGGGGNAHLSDDNHGGADVDGNKAALENLVAPTSTNPGSSSSSSSSSDLQHREARTEVEGGHTLQFWCMGRPARGGLRWWLPWPPAWRTPPLFC